MAQVHYKRLPKLLEHYADERSLEYHRYSPYHMRIYYRTSEECRVILDAWTTRKYWVKETNYYHDIVERGSETGLLPEGTKALFNWLDKLFFAVEIKNEAN